MVNICARTQARWAYSVFKLQCNVHKNHAKMQDFFGRRTSIFFQENICLENWILELCARRILGIVFLPASIEFLIFCNNPVASGCEFMVHLPTVSKQTILPALGMTPQLTIWWDHDSITWPPHVVSVKHFIENWQDIRAGTYCSMRPWILAGLQCSVSKLHLACKSQANRTGWCHCKL